MSVVLEAGARASAHRILAVEDEVLVRLMMPTSCEEADLPSWKPPTWMRALAILESSSRVDLVLTDVQMPGRMDGLALARFLRENRPKLKVIVASAHRPNVDFPENVIAYLRKPYDVDRAICTQEAPALPVRAHKRGIHMTGEGL